MEKKLLIGSCGGLTGYYLAKLFKLKRPDLSICGIDAGNPLASLFLLDNFNTCPNASDQKMFIDFLISYVNEYKIRYYLPTHSIETLAISKYEKEVREHSDVKFIISPYETFLNFDSKLNANEAFSNIGFRVPKLYLNEKDVVYPAYAKPEIGSGSKNSFIIENSSDYYYFKQKYPSLLVMEYLDGQEYTVDVMFDSTGKLVSYNQRIRIKQMGGATVYTQNEFSAIDIYRDLIKLSENYIFKGVVNFQFILKNEKAYYTDVNLRYASGGLPLSVESGIDISSLLISILDDVPIDYSQYQSDRKRRIMYRSFEEWFEL